MKDFTEQKGVKKMPAYKNKDNGSWYVVTQYTDWTGERKPKCKRGFATRREALEWEQKFQQQSAGDLDMSFEAFVEIYTTDLKTRLKESTWQTKEHIIQTKIVPYFGKRKINEITTKDVIAWQNELLAYRDEKHKPYSQSYLKTLHNQLSAIFCTAFCSLKSLIDILPVYSSRNGDIAFRLQLSVELTHELVCVGFRNLQHPCNFVHSDELLFH